MSEIFHVLSRGVDKREIFLDDSDRLRFIHGLYEFNNRKKVNNAYYSFYNDFASHYKKERDLLVDIHAFCLMPNHYHLLMSPKVENGIIKFMSKVNIGYAKYFNQKYERKGTLFEGRYKKIWVNKDAHFMYLPLYIHFNPLDLKCPEWRNKKLNNYQEAVDFLNSYRWGSHLDYSGIHNFPSILNKDLLLEQFGGIDGYKDQINSWLKEINLNNLESFVLE